MKIINWMKTNKLKTAGLGVLILVFLVGMMMSEEHISPLSWGWHQPYDVSDGLALQGYDPVSYHTAGVAQQGSAENSWTWQQAEWHFVSAENMNMFKQNPEQYAPQFGGHCAKAVSAGFTARVNPQFWHIEDGKLYMFHDEGPKQEWVAEIPNGVIGVSEKSWQDR